MTSHNPGDQPSPDDAARLQREDGPYVLRPLLADVPLAADGSQGDVEINCVEYFESNLYVGTSASELLHFVQIPPGPTDRDGKTLFILASRLSPTSSEPGAAPSSRPGVQQILLLPAVGKACILCNGTVTFYSLPELSPVSGIGPVRNCGWIGGVDLNDTPGETTEADVTVLLSLKRRIQVVRVGDGARAFKKIDYAGSTLSVRRDSIACVADSKSYALLDIDRQLKIPLMSISSLDESPPPDQVGQAQSIAPDAAGGIIRSASNAERRPQSNTQGHSRSASHGGLFLGSHGRQEHHSAEDEDLGSHQPSPPAPSTSPQPMAHDFNNTAPSLSDKPLPAAPSDGSAPDKPPEQQASPPPLLLQPHIASPAAEEFLLVIGTSPSEPGIGMFVNLDGEPTRAPIQFETYPKQIAVDGTPADLSSSRSGLPDEDDGHVLASMAKKFDHGLRHGLEIQRCGAGNESPPEKHWLEADGEEGSGAYGLRSLAGSDEIQLLEVVWKLCQRRFSPFPGPVETSTSSLKSSDSRTALSIERLSNEKQLFERDDSQDEDPLPDGWEAARNSEGEEFVRRLAKSEVKLAVWAGDCIWWAVRNPLINQLDAILDTACLDGYTAPEKIDRHAIFTVLGKIRDRDAKTELEFLTFGYIRQKAGLLLLISLLASTGAGELSDGEMGALKEILVDSKLDARVVLSLLPGLRNEIVEGKRGIWIYGGVREVIDAFLRSTTFANVAKSGIASLQPRTLHFLRRFLSSWRKMKGFGSVSDEIEVFHSVDAALLTVLLELDQHSPKGMGKGGAVRSELYELVDRGVDCFDRAVDLLESYHRLFVLSRLYQSRKMAGDVLATWKRIVEGEEDQGQELRDGEERVREYLKKISNQALVREYGVWLANRNPRLGVQVFAEDQSRAPKFEPARAVEILREEAPNAVKYYLEHLVFGKGHSGYVNELIAYYLDVVLGDLESAASSREAVMAAYDTYRALQAPKPTYHNFLTENAPENDEVWQSRLRLLQLLGGAHDYDSAAIRARISSLPGDLLVPETIILAGRERHHEDALRLLVHRLGDYDTAVAYCLRGGTSVYVPPEGRRRRDSLSEIEQQRRLFQVVLHEFLAIEDASDRVEQTGALLERFGGWFEAEDVLRLVPDSWPVDVLAGFLIGALRRLVLEKHESTMARALSGAENLRVNYDLVVEIGEKGPTIEAPS